MVRLMIGEMNLEQMQPTINCFRQSQFTDELVNQANPAKRRSHRTTGQFKLRAGSPHHRLRQVLGIVEFVQTKSQPTLASFDSLANDCHHSKSFCEERFMVC